MNHGAEIADALDGGTVPPPYRATSFTNPHGKRVVRMQFASAPELERFFINELIGSGMLKGSSFVIVGSELLIWDR